jgi:hypothetical protein
MEHCDLLLYTISEIFSKYPEIASMWRQTGKLPYKVCSNIQQISQLTISRDEFYKYAGSITLSKSGGVYLFSICDENDILAIMHERYGNWFYSSSRVSNTYSYHYVDQTFWDYNSLCSTGYEDIVNNYINEETKFPWTVFKYPRSFRDSQRKVFFDVVTTYQILKAREMYDGLSNNYAKEKVSEQFDEIFNIFLNNNMAACAIYLSLNAKIINRNNDNKNDLPTSVAQMKTMASQINRRIKSWN